MSSGNKRKVGILCMGLLCVSLLVGCGSGGSGGVDESRTFSWWIGQTDSMGKFYDDYSENVAVQWIMNQKWDTENHTRSTDDSGNQLSISWQVPITGAEIDNFNTMIGTGQYPEIIDLAYSSENAKQLYDDGVVIEITDYVNEYLPNYLAWLEEHPEKKAFTTVVDEEGNEHYYALYGAKTNVRDAWGGNMYRRDWVVKYAVPSEYVWDWDSTYVKENGHPAVTPLSSALAEGNLEGWKENDICTGVL